MSAPKKSKLLLLKADVQMILIDRFDDVMALPMLQNPTYNNDSGIEYDRFFSEIQQVRL